MCFGQVKWKNYLKKRIRETDHAWTVLNSRNANVSTPPITFTQHLPWISWGDKRPESGAVGSCLIWKLTLGAFRLRLPFIHSLLSATAILKSTANGKKNKPSNFWPRGSSHEINFLWGFFLLQMNTVMWARRVFTVWSTRMVKTKKHGRCHCVFKIYKKKSSVTH